LSAFVGGRAGAVPVAESSRYSHSYRWHDVESRYRPARGVSANFPRGLPRARRTGARWAGGTSGGVVDGGRVAEWGERSGGRMRYRNEGSRRSLQLVVTRTEHPPEFDASIWRFD